MFLGIVRRSESDTGPLLILITKERIRQNDEMKARMVYNGNDTEQRLADTDENGNADNADASQRRLPQMIFILILSA